MILSSGSVKSRSKVGAGYPKCCKEHEIIRIAETCENLIPSKKAKKVTLREDLGMCHLCILISRIVNI